MAAELPIIASGEFVLERSQGRVQLVRPSDKAKPVYIDFTQGAKNLAQVRRALSGRDPLLKAVGPGQKVVWDLTAGLGGDALRLALHGHQVTAFERSPILQALLADGVARALALDEFKALFESQLEFRFSEARFALKQLLLNPSATRPQVLYLDPMYPHSAHGSALPRKELAWLRAILMTEPDDGGEELMRLALKLSVPRVVVKRPLRAQPLSPEPTHSFVGSSTRFDLYVGTR